MRLGAERALAGVDHVEAAAERLGVAHLDGDEPPPADLGRDGQASNPLTFTISPSGGGTVKVFITEPASGAIVKGTVWFTVWLEGAAAGSRTVTLSVGGRNITSTQTTSNGPISLPWPTTATDNGSRTATVSVSDSVGNTGSASITLTVAN